MRWWGPVEDLTSLLARNGKLGHGDERAAAETVVEDGSEDWQLGNTGAEATEAAAGGAAEDGPGTAAEARVGPPA